MKNIRSKKGAALVAVLIGILFISILGSSLLYMATMNYQMKNMRQLSTDNFYSAEYALDDMLGQLKQFSYTKAEPIKELDKYLKKDTPVGGKTVFDEEKLEKLIAISHYVDGLDKTFGTNGVEVSSIYKVSDTNYTRSTYEKINNYIYLRGVQITVKTDADHGDYMSTITTDIAFGFPENGSGNAGLNDFSVLMDSPIYVNGGSPNFCSDVYARANDKHSMGRIALKVGGDQKGICSLLGQFNFFQGDVEVNGGSSLFIGGTCYINGDLNIASTGQCIVSGSVYVRGKVTGEPILSGGGSVVKDEETHAAGYGGAWNNSTNKDNCHVKWTEYDTKFGDGLAGKLVAESIYLHIDNLGSTKTWWNSETSANEAISGDSKQLELTQKQFFWYISGMSNTSSNGVMAVSQEDPNIKAIYQTNGVSHGISNTLIVSPGSPTAYHGSVQNSTWLITCNDGILEIEGGTDNFLQVWGSMDDRSYDLAKSLFFQASPANSFGGGDQVVFGGKVSNESNAKIYGLKDLDDKDAAQPKLPNGVQLEHYASGPGHDQQYYYVQGNPKTNLFSYNCFFHKDLENILSEFKGGMKGEGDTTTQPTIILSNWTKE